MEGCQDTRQHPARLTASRPGSAGLPGHPRRVVRRRPSWAFASANTGALSRDGTIAYASVGWNVNPDSLDASYLDRLNNAVAPATKAGPQVEYGAGAGEIGHQTRDLTSEVIGLSCALVLLLIMFGSPITAGIPLVAAIFSVLSGLALLGLLARVVTFPTIATLLGLGVAVDYGLFLVARHREQMDSGMEVVRSVQRAAGTSGAAIVGAGRVHGAGPGDRAGTDRAGPGAQGRADRAGTGGADRRGHA